MSSGVKCCVASSVGCCGSVAGIAMPPTQVGGPVPTEARKGRDLQRYGSNGERLVACCIPVRLKGGGLDDAEVLLVSSRGGHLWSFPKGGWDSDETVEAAAKRETVEEAGARGHLQEPMVGTFPFVSGKAMRLNREEGRCVAYVFSMLVEEELPKWPEQGQRLRAWHSLPDAMRVLKSDWMRDALLQWAARQGWDGARLLNGENSAPQLNGRVAH